MSDRSYISGFIKNIKSNYIRMIVGAIISFASSIVYARGLGVELYGVYSFIMWFIAIMSNILGMGLSGTVTKFLPQYYFNNDIDESKILIINFIKKIYTIVGIICILLIFTIPIWENYLKINYNNIYFILLMSIICIIPTTLNGIYSNAIQALQRFDIFAKASIKTQIIIFIGSCIVIVINKNVLLIIFIVLLTTLFQNFIYYRELKKILGIESLFKIRNAKLKDKSSIIKYSFYMYINIIWQQIVWTRSEYFFLGIYTGQKGLAVYGLAYSLVNMINLIFSPIMNVLNNYFSEIVSKNNKELLNKILYTVTKYFIVLLILILCYGKLYSKDIISFIYSDRYSGVIDVFLILLTGLVINQILNVCGALPFYYEKQRFIVVLGILSGIINIVFDILLIPKYGVIGAALANTFSQSIFSINQFVYIKFVIKITFPLKELLLVIIVNLVSYFIINIFYSYTTLKIIFGMLFIPIIIIILEKLKIIKYKQLKQL
ncbi:oligosaccharide flippase family protein [Thermoanaerobacterium sp. RBIITD]|uniref:oligosaccharide flippase family protein n=1 Tax=Thermoanaerobacterium sp. RBIITD TaxID=1550240 RepID=UPI000BB6E1C6|nr:oligosaccharide flippase family protein [Thermoanaerobacterium sp. RBIITD]SNX52918.1 Membrane protein involved in the export of O-antigen and teichoic acid [Thermoanaerobacterium sp. RBIITD]